MKKILLALFLVPSLCFAQATWIGPSSGYWTNASNWDIGQYPGQNMTNNAIIPSGVTVIFDSEPNYNVPEITLGGHLYVTNHVRTDTGDFTFQDNAKLTVAANSELQESPLTGTKRITGTNVTFDIQGIWRAKSLLVSDVTNAVVNLFGSGIIDFQIGALNPASSNTALTGWNTMLVNGMTLMQAFPQVGVSAPYSTLILSNTVCTTPYVAVSLRAGSVGANGLCNGSTFILTGPNAFLDTGGAYTYVPNAANNTGAVLRVENGAVWTNSIVTQYALGVPQVNPCFDGLLSVNSGGTVYGPVLRVGSSSTSRSNVAEVVGSGSVINLGGYTDAIIGGTTATGNTLRVSDGGTFKGATTLTMFPLSILDFTGGTLSAHDFNYNPTARYVLGSNCIFNVESGVGPTYDGLWSFVGGLTIDNGGTLQGQGIVQGGDVILTNGGTIARGPYGEMTVTNMTWAGGGRLLSYIDDVNARPGSGWGVLNVRTQLVFDAASPNYVIALQNCLFTPVLPNFDASQNYVFQVLDANVITGLDFSKITLDTNNLVLPVPSTAEWKLTNFLGRIYVTYAGTPEAYDAKGYVWSGNSGAWSDTTKWTNATAPISGLNTDIELSGSGSSTYLSVNDVAAPYYLTNLFLTSSSSGTDILAGGPLAFLSEQGGIWKSSGGDWIISNELFFASNAMFYGSESLEGTITIATNMTIAGDMIKRGKYMVDVYGSNVMGGKLIINSRGGGGVAIKDNGIMLPAGGMIISNGILSRTSAYTFGDYPFHVETIITGPGALYQTTEMTTVGSNATLSILNGAQVRSSSGVNVNMSGGTLDVQDGEMWFAAQSVIGNTNDNNTVVIGEDALLDMGGAIMYVGNGPATNNVLRIEGGLVDSAIAYQIGGTVSQTGGNYNGIIVTNGTLQVRGVDARPFSIGNGIGASYNFLDIKKGGEVVSIATGNGSRTYIGNGQNATGNWIRVDGGVMKVISDSNSSGLRIGFGNSTTSKSVGNHLDIINGGYFQHNRNGAQANCFVDVGASSGADSNYVYVAGTGSTFNAAGQYIPIGWYTGNTGNYVRVENGGLIENAGGLYVGSVAANQPHGNYLSVYNATLRSGNNNSAAIVSGSFNGRENYIEVIDGYWRHTSNLRIGGGQEAAASNNVGNYVLLDNSLVEDLSYVWIGSGTGTPTSRENYLILTNGTTLRTLGEVIIGRGLGCNSNWISVTDSSWDMASSTMLVGSNSACIGNKLIVQGSSVLTRVNALTVSPNNILQMAGGSIGSRVTTISGTLEGQGQIGMDSGSLILSENSLLKPTAAFTAVDVTLPTNMTIDASSLVGSSLLTFSGTVSGASDLSGWTILGRPDAVASLNTGSVSLVIPPFKLRSTNGKIHAVSGKILITR